MIRISGGPVVVVHDTGKQQTNMTEVAKYALFPVCCRVFHVIFVSIVCKPIIGQVCKISGFWGAVHSPWSLPHTTIPKFCILNS